MVFIYFITCKWLPIENVNLLARYFSYFFLIASVIEWRCGLVYVILMTVARSLGFYVGMLVSNDIGEWL